MRHFYWVSFIKKQQFQILLKENKNFLMMLNYLPKFNQKFFFLFFFIFHILDGGFPSQTTLKSVLL